MLPPFSAKIPVLKIPGSGNLIKAPVSGSGNTFGAIYWTDGKREAPMLFEWPMLGRHPETGELFWKEDCEKVGVDTFLGDHPIYGKVPFSKIPELDDYMRALATGLATDTEKKQYIRLRYWWLANDPVRLGGNIVCSEAAYRDNLVQYRTLLDTSDPNQRLTAAEVARALRSFTEAAALLEFSFPKEYSRAVTLIKKLVAEQDSKVRQVS